MEREHRVRYVDARMHALGLDRPTKHELPEGQRLAWRSAPEPFCLSLDQKQSLGSLGIAMQSFYRAADRLYHLGLKESSLSFVPEYLDMGKPHDVVELSRHPRFKGQLPLIMRPDLLWTDTGFMATEFDSIPGGTGLLAGLGQVYGELGYQLPDTARAFMTSFSAVHKGGEAAIVVSEESAGYRPEMQYLADRLSIPCLRPEEIEVNKQGVYHRDRRLSTVYRFFELFDLDNVPGGLELLQAAAQGMVRVTPPPKAYLEEKLWFCLLRHHSLKAYWEKSMGRGLYQQLLGFIPETYILDNRPLPPHAIISGIKVKGQELSSFLELSALPRSARQYVIKPSGFSPESWGSRGVTLGREVSRAGWEETLRGALDKFATTPHVLQNFHYSQLEPVSSLDFTENSLITFRAKLRYCPYYLTGENNTPLFGGVLVTACPSEKPLIHGMTDAVMVPGL